MISELHLKEHIAVILKIKQAEPDVSIFDIIMDYDTETDDFDMTSFLKAVRRNKSFQKFLKDDMRKFNFGKYFADKVQDEVDEIPTTSELF